MQLKRIFYVIGTIVILFFFGCDDGFTEYDAGIEYKLLNDTGERSPENGEYLVYNLLIKQGDSVIYSSAEQDVNFPVRFEEYGLKSGLLSKFQEALYVLKEGDSAVFRVSSEKLFDSSFGSTIKEGMDKGVITYCYIGLDRILTYDEYKAWQKQITEIKQASLAQEKKKIFDEEVKQIEAYLSDKNLEFRATPLGVRYVIKESGVGPPPKNGDSLSFQYDVKYFDGSPVENVGSSAGEVKVFVLGSDGVFPSWQESIRTLRKGGSGDFYIPSTLAFGATGQLGIKPNSILVVSMKLIDIK